MFDLVELATKHGSDKWGAHNYCRHYEAHFADFRDAAVTLLEIGVGGYDDPAAGGASLRMWSDYFPRARIFALDLHDKSPLRIERTAIYRGSQDDPAVLRQIVQDSGGFDIIIDDGSHINAHVIATFNALFPSLRPNGLYVVEDTQTSYWPALGGSSADPDRDTTMMGFFKGFVHGLNHAEFVAGAAPPGTHAGDITALHFYHNMVFVRKGANTDPSNIAASHPLRRAEP